MKTNPYAPYARNVMVEGRAVATDPEGYIQDLDEWSPAFAEALAMEEHLLLTAEHWEVIAFIRDHYQRHDSQAQVRDMIRHFAAVWGAERGTNRYLHDLFPMGGPQKQGNRLAGIRKTRGEH